MVKLSCDDVQDDSLINHRLEIYDNLCAVLPKMKTIIEPMKR